MAGLANALTEIFELPYAWAIFYGPIAQLVERASYTRLVAGSIPARPTMKQSCINARFFIGVAFVHVCYTS